jgi:hypothetical protein
MLTTSATATAENHHSQEESFPAISAMSTVRSST